VQQLLSRRLATNQIVLLKTSALKMYLFLTTSLLFVIYLKQIFSRRISAQAPTMSFKV